MFRGHSHHQQRQARRFSGPNGPPPPEKGGYSAVMLWADPDCRIILNLKCPEILNHQKQTSWGVLKSLRDQDVYITHV